MEELVPVGELVILAESVPDRDVDWDSVEEFEGVIVAPDRVDDDVIMMDRD